MTNKFAGNEKIQKLLRHMMYSEAYGWPPACVGPYYQPMRPLKKQITEKALATQIEHDLKRK